MTGRLGTESGAGVVEEDDNGKDGKEESSQESSPVSADADIKDGR